MLFTLLFSRVVGIKDILLNFGILRTAKEESSYRPVLNNQLQMESRVSEKVIAEPYFVCYTEGVTEVSEARALRHS